MNAEPPITVDGSAAELLGGAAVIGPIQGSMDLHLKLYTGLPAAVWTHLRSHLDLIADEPELLMLIGRAPRSRRLSRTRSNRVWTFARLLVRATDVFGGSTVAQAWFMQPAMALERRRPLELLMTSVGAQMVEDHLTRMDLGVYT